MMGGEEGDDDIGYARQEDDRTVSGGERVVMMSFD